VTVINHETADIADAKQKRTEQRDMAKLHEDEHASKTDRQTDRQTDTVDDDR